MARATPLTAIAPVTQVTSRRGRPCILRVDEPGFD